jgi:hypothetical protein
MRLFAAILVVITLGAAQKRDAAKEDEAEDKRLASLAGEFSLLDGADQIRIRRARLRIPNVDFAKLDESDLSAVKQYPKFFHKRELEKVLMGCAADRGLADDAIRMLKLTDEKEIRHFRLVFGSRFDLGERLGIIASLDQASKKGLGSLTSDQRSVLRLFVNFIGNLPQ